MELQSGASEQRPTLAVQVWGFQHPMVQIGPKDVIVWRGSKSQQPWIHPILLESHELRTFHYSKPMWTHDFHDASAILV